MGKNAFVFTYMSKEIRMYAKKKNGRGRNLEQVKRVD